MLAAFSTDAFWESKESFLNQEVASPFAIYHSNLRCTDSITATIFILHSWLVFIHGLCLAGQWKMLLDWKTRHGKLRGCLRMPLTPFSSAVLPFLDLFSSLFFLNQTKRAKLWLPRCLLASWSSNCSCSFLYYSLMKFGESQFKVGSIFEEEAPVHKHGKKLSRSDMIATIASSIQSYVRWRGSNVFHCPCARLIQRFPCALRKDEATKPKSAATESLLETVSQLRPVKTKAVASSESHPEGKEACKAGAESAVADKSEKVVDISRVNRNITSGRYWQRGKLIVDEWQGQESSHLSFPDLLRLLVSLVLIHHFDAILGHFPSPLLSFPLPLPLRPLLFFFPFLFSFFLSQQKNARLKSRKWTRRSRKEERKRGRHEMKEETREKEAGKKQWRRQWEDMEKEKAEAGYKRGDKVQDSAWEGRRGEERVTGKKERRQRQSGDMQPHF